MTRGRRASIRDHFAFTYLLVAFTTNCVAFIRARAVYTRDRGAFIDKTETFILRRVSCIAGRSTSFTNTPLTIPTRIAHVALSIDAVSDPEWSINTRESHISRYAEQGEAMRRDATK
jgi:hypothetical protein